MMISPAVFLDELKANKVNYFVGVPDSLMKGLNYQISNSCSSDEHLITSNEGSAVAHAIGYYAATEKLAAVYMQNSGLGNAYNPLISLADPAIYSVPMILLIGWRGEIADDGFQLKDEPQHIKQGQITLSTLETMGIPFEVIHAGSSNWKQQISALIARAKSEQRPVAAIFRKNTFDSVSLLSSDPDHSPVLGREEAIERVVDNSNPNDIFVASTGMIGRELFEIRKRRGQTHATDFLTVGGMGHASQIACSIASALPDRRVICLDGDGALLMHTGGMAECARQSNLMHIILNNGAHDSVGGQPTVAFNINLQKVAEGFGYSNIINATSASEIKSALDGRAAGSMFLEIRCKRGNRKDLGRPDIAPNQNLKEFIQFLKGSNNDA
jgi:phosphonopyruvate decarboxylase